MNADNIKKHILFSNKNKSQSIKGFIMKMPKIGIWIQSRPKIVNWIQRRPYIVNWKQGRPKSDK